MLPMLATCPEEVKPFLEKELLALGAVNIRDGYRALSFYVDEPGFYKVHLWLRGASHLFWLLKESSGTSKKIIFSQAQRVKWHLLFGADKSFRVDAITGDRGADKLSSNEISQQVRQAIEEVFDYNLKQVPSVELKEPQVVVQAYLRSGRLSLYLRTSGKSLHKRGYRQSGHPAPLKETLAASLLSMLGYDGKSCFYDPMCGSGSIVIEAALQALNKPSHIHRKKSEFGFEHLKRFDPKIWRKIQEEARSQRLTSAYPELFASDINSDFIKIAEHSAEKARVGKEISFEVKDFFASKKPAAAGFLLANLPYGDRLQNLDADFYRKLGDHLKQEYSGWRAGLLVRADSAWRHIGLRPDKKFNLKNGGIEAKFIVFDLYSGKRL